MIRGHKIFVVIPAYRVCAQIKSVIRSLPAFVDQIIVVDDACPENSHETVSRMKNHRVILHKHRQNLGVGGAVKSGYRVALDKGAHIVVKVDGDGQMDSSYMRDLIEPILAGRADYTKGNRFFDFRALKQMPFIRLFGNSGLSFLLKVCSGYWHIFDPTNGYTAIHRNALEPLLQEKLANRYFFESDILIKLGILGAVVEDVRIPALYAEETSSLSIMRVLFGFPPRLLVGFMRRIFFRYYLYDFNMGSVYGILGMPLFLFGIVFGAIRWKLSIIDGVDNPPGTIMLAALPIILGMQLLLQAIQIDMTNIPRKRKS